MTSTDIQQFQRVTIKSAGAYSATVSVFEAGSVFEARTFRNLWTAVRWACSWGLPVEADTEDLRELVETHRILEAAE